MSSAGRAFAYAVIGWLVPLIVALPLTTTYETVGGQAVFLTGAVWLLLLGPIGCAIAGWLASRLEPRATSFGSGLAGCFAAVVPVFIVDTMVTVLTIGIVAFALVLPLAIAFAVGFAAGIVVAGRRGTLTG